MMTHAGPSMKGQDAQAPDSAGVGKMEGLEQRQTAWHSFACCAAVACACAALLRLVEELHWF